MEEETDLIGEMKNNFLLNNFVENKYRESCINSHSWDRNYSGVKLQNVKLDSFCKINFFLTTYNQITAHNFVNDQRKDNIKSQSRI